MSERLTDWENWWEHGEYDGTSCAHCGRERVMIADAPDGAERRAERTLERMAEARGLLDAGKIGSPANEVETASEPTLRQIGLEG